MNNSENIALNKEENKNEAIPTMVESAVEETERKAKFSLAMAYVPIQKFENLYTSTMALKRGTLFKDLDFPLLREEVIPRER